MNNNFIPAEEFLKQSEKVRDNIKTWLELNMQEKEWVKFIEEGGELPVNEVLDTRKDNIDVGRVFYFGECLCWTSIHDDNVVPLLQMHQFIDFIEDKSKEKIDIKWLENEGYTIIEFDSEGNPKIKYRKLGHDLLEALWQVAIQITEGE